MSWKAGPDGVGPIDTKGEQTEMNRQSDTTTDTATGRTDRDGTVVRDVVFERHLQAEDGSGLIMELGGELRYAAEDPFAATLMFATAAGPVLWTVSRDVLLDGCYAPAGDGDVRVWPGLDEVGRSRVFMELSSPEGPATLTASTEDVVEFGRHVHAMVSPGTEADLLDLDGVILRILQEA